MLCMRDRPGYRPQHISCTSRMLMTGPLQPRIRDAFLSLADTLEQLPAAWDAASLCEAWRVREVVAHISTAARYLPEQFLTEVQADGGDLNRTVDRIASRDGGLDPET